MNLCRCQSCGAEGDREDRARGLACCTECGARVRRNPDRDDACPECGLEALGWSCPYCGGWWRLVRELARG